MRKVIVTISNVQSQIHGLTKKDYKILRKECGWRDKNYFFSTRYKKNKGWDGYHTLLTPKGKFPTGLHELVVEKLNELDIKVRVQDNRKKVKINYNKILRRLDDMGIILRPYQIDGVICGLENPHMLFEWPTASGKAVLFASLIQAYNLRTLIIVNKKELLYQLAEVLKEVTTMKVGVIGDGIWDPQRITVASVGTLARKIKEEKIQDFLNLIQYFISDETHHLAATTWKKVAMGCKNAIVRHGFSGTCFRTDSKDILLLATTGPIKHKITATELIKKGYLSRPYIDLIYMDNPLLDADWSTAKEKLIVNNHDRNLIGVKYIKHYYEKNKQVLVITDRIRHPKMIQEMLVRDEHLPWKDVRYMSGQKDTSQRQQALLDFRNRKLPILIGTSIYDEGVDLPSADVGVNFAGGDSEIKTIQRLGRILRKTRGMYDVDIDPQKPQKVRYLDFIDKGSIYTERHSHHRAQVYEAEEGFRVEKSNGHSKSWYPHRLRT